MKVARQVDSGGDHGQRFGFVTVDGNDYVSASYRSSALAEARPQPNKMPEVQLVAITPTTIVQVVRLQRHAYCKDFEAPV
jgi:hypothetical protein